MPANALEQAFHSSPALQSILRASDRVFVQVNDTFLRKLKRTRAEVVGKTPDEVDFWVDSGVLAAYREELGVNGFVSGFHTRLRASDGTVMDILLSTHPAEMNGELHFVSAGVDITAQTEAQALAKENEARMRESETRFATAFSATPVMTTIARLADGKYIEVNDAFQKWLGLDRDDIMGHSWDEFNLWDNPSDGEKFFEELLRLRSVRDVECDLHRRDGTRCTLLVSADIIEIQQVPHIIGFALDITERKRAEAERESALQQARELSDLKSSFVSLVSHEFRTPLEIIMSSVDNLERYHDRLPAEKREHLLRTINKSVRRMAGMMEEVLLLGRLDSGGTEFKPQPIDLLAFCNRVVDEMESATSRRCPIELETGAGLVGACADEGVLRHILSNLISNAVKYSEAGRTVTFAVHRAGGHAVFRIADRGCGIPAADQPRLFQAFNRGSNVSQTPGTGLGLLIVKRCVDLHRGEIAFESTEGNGTTFTVRLPLFEATP